MFGRGVWALIKGHAHQLFPVLAILDGILILTSPLYPWPLSWLSDNSFARFCMFWALALCIVLAFANHRLRPAGIAVFSILASIAVGVVFIAIHLAVTDAPEQVADIALSAIAGAILGALAGTWLLYVLEVYIGR